MIRGLLWLLWRAPAALLALVRFLVCVLITWHLWRADRTRDCRCVVRECARCGWTKTVSACGVRGYCVRPRR